MRWLDINVNVNWPLAHYKSAVRYLHKDPVDIAATGGTNWQKYLPRGSRSGSSSRALERQGIGRMGQRLGGEGSVWTGMKRTRKGLAWVLGTSLVIVGCDDSRFSSNGLGGMFQSAPEPEPVMRFGVLWENFVVDSGKVQPGESLSHLLDPTGFGPGKVATLAANSRKDLDVRYMKAGHRWWLASETAQDSGEAEARLKPKWLVYERNPKDFARFSLGDTLAVTLGSYPVDTLYARATGTIENSLYMDFDKAGTHEFGRGHGQCVRVDH